MTNVDISTLMQLEMAAAIEQKRKLGTGDDNFRMSIKIVGPGGSVADVPLQWSSMQDKYLKMGILSHLCEHVSAVAAVVTSDVRRLNSKAFCSRFKLDYADSAMFKKEYDRIMADYNHEMVNLPRETWEESLFVVAYGPRTKKMLVAPYAVVGGGFMFERPEFANEDAELEVGLIPAWWV